MNSRWIPFAKKELRRLGWLAGSEGSLQHDGTKTIELCDSTIIDNVAPFMIISREETIEPLVSTMMGRSLNEAVKMIHSNPFGDATSVYTLIGKQGRERCKN